MKYRNLGNTGIQVSEIGFGTWTLALDWWGKKLEEDESIKMLKHAYDLGINFFETADMYGKGKSEKLLAKAFKDMRSEVIYSTKWGYDMYTANQIGHGEIPQKHNPEFLDFALSESLNRLETDFVDVYSLHNPKMEAIENNALFDRLDELVKTGKIKSHGVALGPAIGWEKEGLYAIENRNIVCLQTVYNILEQDPGRVFFNAVDTRANNSVGIMVRVPDASGVLTGKVNEHTVFDKNDHRNNRKKEWIIQAMKKIEKLKPIADSHGWNITELSMKYILSQKEISVLLPTVTSLEEIDLFAQISDGNYLSADEKTQIERMYENNFDMPKLLA
ncbi:aldo/keto reductase [Candidatus Nitrosocosmicus hydrocola]|uniref:aldo/keto reductase n=1 Tax=Candidatus Nitrosocosmicus hydrocola TaxID=1826872 RepID=UPI000A53172C|nr:aldo/keto reductase [Candidatus Nitrosocosmicus hydrocola]